MKRRILIAVIVALLAGTGYAVWHFNNKEEENGKRLTLYGNVDIREVNLGFRVGGRVAQMRFEEGDSVHAGDVMAVLDKAPFQHDLALALAQLETRRANYQKMQAGTRPEDIAQARARVAEQEATLKNAGRIYERQKSLVKKDVASKQAYEDALASKTEAQARRASARAALDLALAGFRKEDIRAGGRNGVDARRGTWRHSRGRRHRLQRLPGLPRMGTGLCVRAGPGRGAPRHAGGGGNGRRGPLSRPRGLYLTGCRIHTQDRANHGAAHGPRLPGARDSR
jgi:hypothetical protein